MRLAAGYATLDCFRLQTRHQRSGFMRTTGQMEVTANFSKIGIGDPLDFAPGVCSSEVRADPYSRQLNYYLAGTYTVARAGRHTGARSIFAVFGTSVRVPRVPEDDLHRRVSVGGPVFRPNTGA